MKINPKYKVILLVTQYVTVLNNGKVLHVNGCRTFITLCHRALMFLKGEWEIINQGSE